MTHARNQDGFALIEVIVSAAILAIIALAMLSGLDGAGQASARERARAQASALAEQDQERLRSLNFEALTDGKVPQTGAVKVADDNAVYTVKSEAQWVTDDSSGAPACGDKNYRATEYLKLISTVTSNIVGVKMQPVRVESLLSTSVNRATGTGTLTVRVLQSQPNKTARVAGLTVTATGPRTLTALTNADGCAMFRAIPIGDYTISLNTSGYGDKTGTQLTTTTATVNPGVVTPAALTYDRLVNMTVDIKTVKPGLAFSSATAATTKASKADSIADNAADTGTRTYTPNPVTWTSNIKPQNLFPFDASYAFFAGGCANQSPTKASSANSDYFTAVNPAAVVRADPDVFQPQSATVYQPSLNLRIRSDSTTNSAAAATNFDASTKTELYMTLPPASGDTCEDVTRLKMRIATWPTGTWGTQPTGGTAATGFVWQPSTTGEFDPGMPFGTYSLCLRDVAAGKYWTQSYDNTKPDGQGTTVEIPPLTTLRSQWTTTKPSTCP